MDLDQGQLRASAMVSRSIVEPLEGRRLLSADTVVPFLERVNFQPAGPAPDGYVADAGEAFGDRGNGLTYGWSVDNRKGVGQRNSKLSPDARYDTFAKFPKRGSWSIVVPNGTYTVHLVAGDPKGAGRYGVNAEEVPLLNAKTSKKQRWVEGTMTVAVNDGALTISCLPRMSGKKLDYVDVEQVVGTSPSDPSVVTDTGPITWQTLAPSPITRAESVGTVVNGKLYVMGGFHGLIKPNHYIAQARCDVFDPATNTWTRIADMPEPFTHSQAAVDGTTMWFVGAYVGNHPGPGTTHVWKYDTATNVWSRGPDLPVARGAGASAIVGRELHFFGGMNKTRTIDEADQYVLNLDDVAAGWTKLASMPTARNHVSAAAVNGQIYVIGGQTQQEEQAKVFSVVEKYDPGTDTWSKVASLPAPRSHVSEGTFVLDGKIIVVGGETGYEQQQKTIFSYDPATDTWSTIGELPAVRSTTVSGIINGDQILTATGNSPNGTDTCWLGTLRMPV